MKTQPLLIVAALGALGWIMAPASAQADTLLTTMNQASMGCGGGGGALGQTFTAPSDCVLDEFSVELSGRSYIPTIFVYAWNPSRRTLIGPPLFVGAPDSVSPIPGPDREKIVERWGWNPSDDCKLVTVSMGHLMLTPGQTYIVLMAVSGDLLNGWVAYPDVCKEETYNVTNTEGVAVDDDGMEGRAVSIIACDENGEYEFVNRLSCKPEDFKPEDKGSVFRLTDLMFTAHFSSLSDALTSSLPSPKRWKKKHLFSGQAVGSKSLA